MQGEHSDVDVWYCVKIMRYLRRKMIFEKFYPKRNLSKLGKGKYNHSYLLRNLPISDPNLELAIEITYKSMKVGFSLAHLSS